ncbi:MAG: ribose 5-phosphate isomerase B [Candidatus Riflebacteria bacterium]|nr:ribose 5-phosphate isomerase B [Candidatus Riflebacteria bacterium]
MRVAIGADHGGFALKEVLKQYLIKDLGHEVKDFGVDNPAPVDYPDIALAVAQSVSRGECPLGIIVDGAGIGSAMVANKVPGVRAAMGYDLYSVNNSREHNDANVLTLGGQTLGPGHAKVMVKTWLETPFAGGRHLKRVEKIVAVERSFLGRGGR